jgi:hypothetical protein
MKPSYDRGESRCGKRQCSEQLSRRFHEVGQDDPLASSLDRGLGAKECASKDGFYGKIYSLLTLF